MSDEEMLLWFQKFAEDIKKRTYRDGPVFVNARMVNDKLVGLGIRLLFESPPYDRERQTSKACRRAARRFKDYEYSSPFGYEDVDGEGDAA